MASSDGDGENSSDDAVSPGMPHGLPDLLPSSDEEEEDDDEEQSRSLGDQFVLALSGFAMSRPRRLAAVTV